MQILDLTCLPCNYFLSSFSTVHFCWLLLLILSSMSLAEVFSIVIFVNAGSIVAFISLLVLFVLPFFS